MLYYHTLVDNLAVPHDYYYCTTVYIVPRVIDSFMIVVHKEARNSGDGGCFSVVFPPTNPTIASSCKRLRAVLVRTEA